MRTQANERPLREIVDRPDDLSSIISLYLDATKSYDLQTYADNRVVVFEATGMGLDGEPQRVWMNYNGQLHRQYDLPGFSPRLAVTGCSVLCMLYQMGYKLHEYQMLKVRKYALLTSKAQFQENYA